MRPLTFSFRTLLCMLVLLLGTSCEKNEKQAIEKSKTVSEEDGSGKAKSTDSTPLMYYGKLAGCDVPNNLCASPIVVTPTHEDEQDDLNDAIANGRLEELNVEDLESLFPDLERERIEKVIAGETDLCKIHHQKEKKTYYIAFKKDAGITCQEARSDKRKREWVYPLKNE
ncbi:MAG: hypothetical protein ABEH38_07105 [Flavobacteriales bacterium]